MVVVLIAVCLAAGGLARHGAPATLADADSTAGLSAGLAAHPPTRDYGLDLPPSAPAASPSLNAAPGLEAGPAAPPPQPSTAAPSGPGIGAGGSASAAQTLRGADRQIPTRMLTAYRKAASRLGLETPRCHLRWELLAGIGRVESDHARGRVVTADGTLTSRILGPELDGRDGRALIRDSDGGRLDGDTRYDRAVGPMQFIPTTWATSGRDGSADGRADPNNIDDASLAAGAYLCRGGRDLALPDGLRAAIYSYNPSASYVRSVLAWMSGYAGTTVIASPAASATPRPSPTPGPPTRTSPIAPATSAKQSASTPAGRTTLAAAPRQPSSTPAPARTSPTRSASPTPTPQPPHPRPHIQGLAASANPQPRTLTSPAPDSPDTTAGVPKPTVPPSNPPLLVITLTPSSGSGSPRAPTPTP
ncbi:Membrane-bound lytic murein transglycosylase B [Frankia sp. AiPs1]